MTTEVGGTCAPTGSPFQSMIHCMVAPRKHRVSTNANSITTLSTTLGPLCVTDSTTQLNCRANNPYPRITKHGEADNRKDQGCGHPFWG